MELLRLTKPAIQQRPAMARLFRLAKLRIVFEFVLDLSIFDITLLALYRDSVL